MLRNFFKGCGTMPSAITHFLHAQKALDLFRSGENASIVPEAFLWGAQGPDFLFYHNRYPWRKGEGLRPYGDRLHDELPSRLLGAMRDFYRGTKAGENDILRSYLCGFLCHYSLDRTAHPYVYAQIRNLEKDYPDRSESFLHCMIESELDVIILRMERNQLTTDFDLKRAVPWNEKILSVVAALYVSVLNGIYGEKATVGQVMRAMKDCREIQGLLNDRTTFKKSFLQSLEKRKHRYGYSCFFRGISETDGYDYANVFSSEWRWPPESPYARSESFFDLYEASVREGAGFMNTYFNAENLTKLTGEIRFD